MKVALKKITKDTVRTICELSVTENQKKFVAPNAISIAQAYFHDFAWFRAIYVDEDPIGFVMLSDIPELPEYYLWRFMIDAKYQRLGYGQQAIKLVIDYVKSRPKSDVLITSTVQAKGGPQKFYEKQGFKLTGDYEGGEAIMKLILK